MPVLGTAGAATLGIRHSDSLGLKGPLPLFRPSPFPHQKQPLLCIHSGFWLGFLKKILVEAGKVIWYSHLFKKFPQFVVIHTVKGFSIVSEAEVAVFLEFSCFSYDPTDVGNLISGSSVFSKSSLNIWKFLVHVLLKTSLKDFEHDLFSM